MKFWDKIELFTFSELVLFVGTITLICNYISWYFIKLLLQ